MNISIHGKEIPTVEIEDRLLDVNGKDRILTYITVRCGNDEVRIDVFADDAAELSDTRKRLEVA